LVSVKHVQGRTGRKDTENCDSKLKHNETKKFYLRFRVKNYRNYENNTTLFIALTLLTETRVNVEQYGGHR